MSAPTDAPAGAAPAGASRAVEIAAALVLAAGGVASSWCGYRATHWSGAQMRAFGTANALHIDAARESTRHQVMASIDVSAYLGWLEARLRGDAATADFIRSRFRPDFVPAFTAWLAESPFERPEATRTPFARPEYALESAQAAAMEAESRRHVAISHDANARVESYVRTTVLFAVAMLFGGLGPRFRSARIRAGFVAMGVATMAVAVTVLARMA